MKQTTYLIHKCISLATSLALVGISVGSLGCGEGGEGGPTIDSGLFGIYEITTYQHSPDQCDSPPDINPPDPYLVLYSYVPNDEPDTARLGGAFCANADTCRIVANARLAPPLGYSFLTGDDASGWLGFAVPRGGPANDQCAAEVQAHTMTSSSAGAINVITQITETTFAPTLEGNVATCPVRDALEAWDESLPCLGIFVLDATFEAGL